MVLPFLYIIGRLGNCVLLIEMPKGSKNNTMNPKTFEEAIDLVLAEMRETLIKKQRLYGSENINSFGEIGILVRMNDKMERLKNLIMNNKKATYEPIEESFLDAACYGLIGLMWRKGIWGLPMAGETDEK